MQTSRSSHVIGAVFSQSSGKEKLVVCGYFGERGQGYICYHFDDTTKEWVQETQPGFKKLQVKIKFIEKMLQKIFPTQSRDYQMHSEFPLVTSKEKIILFWQCNTRIKV